MTPRTFSRLPTHQSPSSSCGPFSTFSHRWALNKIFCLKKLNILCIFYVLDLLPSDALPPRQPCQPLDVGPDLPWGHLGLCQVQVVRARTKFKAYFDLLVPQWRVQRGGCPDRGAYRQSVGQLLPTNPQQGKLSFFFTAVWIVVPLSLCSNLRIMKLAFDQGTIEHSKPQYISMWAEARCVFQTKNKSSSVREDLAVKYHCKISDPWKFRQF